MNQDGLTPLIEGLVERRTKALARLISWAENQDPRIDEVLRRLYPRTGGATRLGVTGPPGAGKSTLITELVRAYRNAGERVAVVAVDPSSPFTGGALLGDRVRMGDLSEDPDVFVRSMATRGSLGGLAAATADVLDLLDAAGFDRLVIETVGVGQVELDVALAADTVLVVLVPESGDGVQAMKAGLMEIGNVFVVNKSDRDGAGVLVRELEGILALSGSPGGWRPPVVETSAVSGIGVEALLAAAAGHRKHLRDTGTIETGRRRTARSRILQETRRMLLEREDARGGDALEALVDRVAGRRLSPREAAAELLQAAGSTGGGGKD